MDLGGWLRSLGLEQYEAIFRENAIDADVLNDLTEDHLREIGLPLGARLKLLKAISALASRAERISPTPTIAPAGSFFFAGLPSLWRERGGPQLTVCLLCVVCRQTAEGSLKQLAHCL
jgi:hypothetical protein